MRAYGRSPIECSNVRRSVRLKSKQSSRWSIRKAEVRQTEPSSTSRRSTSPTKTLASTEGNLLLSTSLFRLAKQTETPNPTGCCLNRCPSTSLSHRLRVGLTQWKPSDGLANVLSNSVCRRINGADLLKPSNITVHQRTSELSAVVSSSVRIQSRKRCVERFLVCLD